MFSLIYYCSSLESDEPDYNEVKDQLEEKQEEETGEITNSNTSTTIITCFTLLISLSN
jgi:hypothetical protein